MISVNSSQFDDSAVLQEMQYHPAKTESESKNKACEALIIGAILKQRASSLNIIDDVAETGTDFLEALLDSEVDIPTASDDECRTYFEQNPGKFTSSPLVEGRHILLASPPDNATERSESIELAKQIISKLQEDIGLFAELAARYSRCPSAKTGGSLGQISKGQTVAEFERQLFNCKKGLVAAPIESRYGVHVVDVNQFVAGNALPFEAVKQRIKDYLNEKVRRQVHHYSRQLAFAFPAKLIFQFLPLYVYKPLSSLDY